MADDLPASTLADRPGFLIRRLHQIHVALFADECAAFGVTPVQYSLLTVAADRPGSDQARLAHAVGIDRATTASVLARLQARGLLRRAPSPADRRLKLVTLTAKGRRVLEALAVPAARAHARTVAALGETERAAFLQALRVLVEAGNDSGRAPLRLG
jgi:DNA-binding MarR family transcriptional regulator